MAGTAPSREAELERVRRSEANTYYSGSGTASKYKEGFTKSRSPKDPNKTSADTPGPNGRG